MATLSQRRGLQNVNSLRRKLRNMHKVTENSIKPVIEEVAEAIRLDAIDRVPKDTGELARFDREESQQRWPDGGDWPWRQDRSDHQTAVGISVRDSQSRWYQAFQSEQTPAVPVLQRLLDRVRHEGQCREEYSPSACQAVHGAEL